MPLGYSHDGKAGVPGAERDLTSSLSSIDAIIPDDLATPRHAWLKRGLATFGTRAGRWAHHVQAALNYVLLGAWIREHGFGGGVRVRDRRALYRYIASVVAEREPLLYLEFGVYRGASIQAWSRLLTNPGSRFIGFDSFEGMPEDFDARTGVVKGGLNVQGRLPAITDSRVTFVKGWFSDTLSRFVIPPHDHLVVHVDCDLYSATASVLEFVAPSVRPGTIFLFDDMGQPQHEPRAFAEYLRTSGRRFRLVANDWEDHYAFECEA